MSREFSKETGLLVTHVTSQLLNRWISLPMDSQGRSSAADEVISCWRRLSLTSWRKEIEELSESDVIPWMAPLLAKKPGLIEKISYYCHNEIVATTAHHATLLLYNSSNYPSLLREIPDPPAVLTVVGNASLLSRPTAAVVGARKASGFAVRESFLMGRILGEAGQIVVSGGAFGCDIAAHQGVLSLAEHTVPAAVVLAGGLSATYPRGNEHVFRQLRARGGAFITERLWWSPPRPRDFAARNRIVSGMCPEVFVMQAGEKSGALITARTALDQGREVWVLEHEKDDIRARGGNWLIEDGAQAFQGAQQFKEIRAGNHV